MARPNWVTSISSPDELPRGIEHAQDAQLLFARRLGRRQPVRHLHLEAGIGPYVVHADPGVESLDAHPSALRVEAEEAERRHHARDAAEEQAAFAAAVAALEPAGA